MMTNPQRYLRAAKCHLWLNREDGGWVIADRFHLDTHQTARMDRVCVATKSQLHNGRPTMRHTKRDTLLQSTAAAGLTRGTAMITMIILASRSLSQQRPAAAAAQSHTAPEISQHSAEQQQTMGETLLVNKSRRRRQVQCIV